MSAGLLVLNLLIFFSTRQIQGWILRNDKRHRFDNCDRRLIYFCTSLPSCQELCVLFLGLCVTCVNYYFITERCFTSQSWLPNCLPLLRDSHHAAGWSPRRNDTVFSPLWVSHQQFKQNALVGWIRFSGPGVCHRLSFRRGLAGARCRREPHRERQQRDGRRQRLRPSRVHQSDSDNRQGGELCADWLQHHWRPVPQCRVVQLPRRAPGHAERWGWPSFTLNPIPSQQNYFTGWFFIAAVLFIYWTTEGHCLRHAAFNAIIRLMCRKQTHDFNSGNGSVK